MRNENVLGFIDLTLLEQVERENIVRKMIYHNDGQLKRRGQYITGITFSISYRDFIDREPIPSIGYEIYYTNYANSQVIASHHLLLEHSTKSYLGAELLRRVLSETHLAFKKECNLEFKDAMNLIYLNALIGERVLTREHITAYFKEFAQTVINEKNDSYHSQGLNVPYNVSKKPISKTYTTDETKPFVDSGIIDFLESNRLLKKGSLTPEVNSADREALSCEEKDTIKWFENFIKKQENYEKKPKFDILKTLGVADNTTALDTLFSEIFEEENPSELEVKFS